MIEMGHHNNIAREYWFYPYCASRSIYKIKDKQHFLLEYPLFHSLRDTCFKPSWKAAVICQQFFICIMQDNSKEGILLHVLSKFNKGAITLWEQTFVEQQNQ